jgi:hypothetical protein
VAVEAPVHSKLSAWDDCLIRTVSGGHRFLILFPSSTGIHYLLNVGDINRLQPLSDIYIHRLYIHLSGVTQVFIPMFDQIGDGFRITDFEDDCWPR